MIGFHVLSIFCILGKFSTFMTKPLEIVEIVVFKCVTCFHVFYHSLFSLFSTFGYVIWTLSWTTIQKNSLVLSVPPQISLHLATSLL